MDGFVCTFVALALIIAGAEFLRRATTISRSQDRALDCPSLYGTGAWGDWADDYFAGRWSL